MCIGIYVYQRERERKKDFLIKCLNFKLFVLALSVRAYVKKGIHNSGRWVYYAWLEVKTSSLLVIWTITLSKVSLGGSQIHTVTLYKGRGITLLNESSS